MRRSLAVILVGFVVLLGVRGASAQTGAPPQTAAQLRSVGIQQADLPGYFLLNEDTTPEAGVGALYSGYWESSGGTGLLIANDLLALPPTTNGPSFLQHFTSGFQTDVGAIVPQAQPVPAIGQAATVFAFDTLIDSGPVPSCAAMFVEGQTLVAVLAGGYPAGTPPQLRCATPIALARVLDARIQAFDAPLAAAPAPVAPVAAAAPLAPALIPQGVVAVAQQYAASVGYGYAGDCTQTDATMSEQICTVVTGPDASGSYTVSYSVVGGDGTPGDVYATQTVTPDMAAAALAATAPQAQPAASPAPTVAPAATATAAPVAAAVDPNAPTAMCPNGFIPSPGNGQGPTLCADGLCSHSAGRGTCSGHGGEAWVTGVELAAA